MLIPPILARYRSNVRVSSDPKDTDIDTIMKKIMKNKVDLRTYDPVFASADTRTDTKGLLLAGSKLAPYKRYVEDPKIANMIEKCLFD